jgi:hypothetical protein
MERKPKITAVSVSAQAIFPASSQYFENHAEMPFPGNYFCCLFFEKIPRKYLTINHLRSEPIP